MGKNILGNIIAERKYIKMVTTPKTFKQGMLLALILSFIFIPLTIGMGTLAPHLLRLLGSIGNYSYKPWIYFSPILIAVGVSLIIAPSYRNFHAIIGLFFGAFSIAIIGGSILLGFAILSIPTMRY